MVRSRSRALLPCLALALFLCPVRARADQSFEPPPASEPPPTSEPPPALLPTAPPPATAPPPSAPPPDPVRADSDSLLGPFVISSPGGRHRVRVSLALQIRANALRSDSGASASSDVSGEFRRLRPSLRGSFFDDRVGFFLQINTIPGSVDIIDAFVNFTLPRGLKLRVGQFKIPYTRFRAQVFTQLLLVDWAYTARFFGAEHQLGLMAHNLSDEATPRLEYAVGLFTGTNARRSFGIGVPTAYGEKPADPSDLAGPNLPQSVHPELILRANYNARGIRTDTDSDSQRGPLRYSVGASLAWNMNPTLYQNFALRLAAEALVKVRGVSLSAVLYGALFRRGEWADLQPAALGAMEQVAYRPVPRWEVALQHDVVALASELTGDAQARAQQLIAAATSDAARAPLTRQYGDVGQVSAEHELTLGCNHYMVGTALKVQTDVAWLHHVRRSDSRDDLRLRLQLQLAF